MFREFRDFRGLRAMGFRGSQVCFWFMYLRGDKGPGYERLGASGKEAPGFENRNVRLIVTTYCRQSFRVKALGFRRFRV